MIVFLIHNLDGIDSLGESFNFNGKSVRGAVSFQDADVGGYKLEDGDANVRFY
jgi:hypothetical protein